METKMILTPNYTLVIRSVRPDMTSRSGFKWPTSGPVEAPDWNPKPVCGGGLHGLRAGDNAPGEWYEGPVLVCCVPTSEIVSLDGKCKFPRCEVVHCGDMASASAYMQTHGNAEGLYRRIAAAGDRSRVTAGYGSRVMAGDRSHVMAGDRSHVMAGDGSHVTAGYGSRVMAGDRSHATAGYGSHVTAGYGSHVTAGDGSHVTAGYGSHVTAGYGSHVTAGDGSHVTAGDGSHVTAGYDSHVMAGDRSHVMAGYDSHATAGYGSSISWRYYDGKRYRIKTVYVGEDGIKPNVAYICTDGEVKEITGDQDDPKH
jgi:hypothetical protein